MGAGFLGTIVPRKGPSPRDRPPIANGGHRAVVRDPVGLRESTGTGATTDSEMPRSPKSIVVQGAETSRREYLPALKNF